MNVSQSYKVYIEYNVYKNGTQENLSVQFSLERHLECDVDNDSVFSIDVKASCGYEKPECEYAAAMHINKLTIATTTILFVDIQGFTTRCATMDVVSVGEWVQSFYTIVQRLCNENNTVFIEHRGYCCVCTNKGCQLL